MQLIHSFGANYVFIFVFLTMLNYGFRTLGSAHRHLVLNDYMVIFGQSVIYCIAMTWNNPWVDTCLWLIATLIFILQWANIIALQFYGIKINVHILKAFSTGMGEFTGEFKDVTVQLAKESKLLILFLYGLVGYVFIFFAPVNSLHILDGMFFAFILNLLTKSKIDRITIWLWCLLTVIFAALAIWVFIPILDNVPSLVYNKLVVASVVVLIGLYLFHFFSKKAFFILPTLLRQQFKDEQLPLQILQQPPELEISDLKLANLAPQALHASEHFGKCPNASIVLITVESLTNYYFSAEEQQEHMPFFTELQQSGITSQHHISPSALTNNALRAIYAGGYPNVKNYPHMTKLQECGYQTCFLSSQKTSEFNLESILREVGFSTIIDNYSLTQKRTQRMPDNEFFKGAFEKLQQCVDLQQPFFLHVMNNQTHGPYFTYEKKLADRKQRYCQAVKESDAELKKLIDQIKAVNNNVIIVYTGDHGESFGEEGYMSHANAVIEPQIQVPLVIQHPNLSARQIKFSSHFDLCPTLFDLLGENYSYRALGQSVFLPSTEPHCLAYCETRMGNTPSSFSIVMPNKKIYFDRHLNKYQIRDLSDNVLQELTGEDYKYNLKLLLLALQERGLIF